MIGAFFVPLALAAAACTQDPPKPEVPPPWGPEGFGLTTKSPAWRGLFVSVGAFAGSDLDMNSARGVETRSNGIDPIERVEVEWDEMEFDAASVKLAFDFDTFRLSASFFTGDYEATGDLRYSDGVNPETATPVDLEGDFFGLRIGGYWPALRYRDAVFEASLGPELSVGWFHLEGEDVPGSPIPIADSVDQLIGTLGPRLSLRLFLGRFAVEAEGAVSLLAGHSRGVVEEFTLGVGYHF